MNTLAAALPPVHMLEAHFQNLPAVICRHLTGAQHRIQIAVCWFSHRDIFEVLLKKLRAGISVELLLEYDSQNIHAHGLDFQNMIRLGGILYAYRDTALMHHKFALLDDGLLLSGSFNWTYNCNTENLLVSDDPGAVEAFRHEFSRLKGLSVHVRKIRPADAKVFAAFPLFQNTHFQLSDLRKRISSGAGVWWVRAGTRLRPAVWDDYFRQHRLPLDHNQYLSSYWSAYRIWDETLLDECWPALTSGISAAAARSLRLLTRRMHAGDLVLAVSGKRSVFGLGIVQSDPKPGDGDTPVSYREVQWLRTFSEAPLPLQQDLPQGTAGKFRGSALQLVQTIFETMAQPR